MSEKELKVLQLPIVLLAAAVTVGIALVYVTGQWLDAAQLDLARQQSQLRDARTRLQRSGDERATIERYLGDFQTLRQLGFVGEEPRINWVEGLRAANQQAQLFGVEYQIAPQNPYPYAAELDPGTLAVRQSVMKLNFRLLHEGDLMRFLAALARQNVGIFTINDCALERVGVDAAPRHQPNLRAECDLAWITLHVGGSAERKP